MKTRLLKYYALFVLAIPVYLFLPSLLQLLFELYVLLATIALPYPGDFLRRSLERLPAFTALVLVSFAAFLGMTDFVIFLSNFNDYASFLLFVPLYLAFRLLTFPWVFLKRGITAPLEAFKSPNEANWTILAVLSVLAIIYRFLPLAVPFLLAPASFFLHGRLTESGNL